MLVLPVALGNVPRGVWLDPRLHYKRSSPRLRAELPLYLVPHFFQNKPLSRLIAPGIQASHLNDDTLGRALDTLYETGVTALYSLIAATAARRLGLTPTFSHLDTTSFHVDGRYNSDPDNVTCWHIIELR